MNPCIFVFGPQSSGTRIWTRLLIALGCHGSYQHEQKWDSKEIPTDVTVIWRRSFPHGLPPKWPKVKHMMERADERRPFRAVVTMRDWYPMARSQSNRRFGVETMEDARERINFAYSNIFGQLGLMRIPTITVSYESLVYEPYRTVEPAAQFLGLRFNPEALRAITISNGNVKWYES